MLRKTCWRSTRLPSWYGIVPSWSILTPSRSVILTPSWSGVANFFTTTIFPRLFRAASRRLGRSMRRTTPASSSATTPDRRWAISISRMSPADDQRPSCSPGTKLGGWRPTSPSCRSYCGGRRHPSKSQASRCDAAIWSLLGDKRTICGHRKSVAHDSLQTLDTVAIGSVYLVRRSSSNGALACTKQACWLNFKDTCPKTPACAPRQARPPFCRERRTAARS